MFGVFIQILKNEDGFTAIEYGLIAAMILVFASQLVSQLWPWRRLVADVVYRNCDNFGPGGV